MKRIVDFLSPLKNNCQLLLVACLPPLALTAFGLYQLQVTENIINAGITLTYIISCFLAGNLAGRQMKQKRFLWGLIMGGAYFVVLLALSMVVNQSAGAVSDSLLLTLFLCAGGGMLGGMLS